MKLDLFAIAIIAVLLVFVAISKDKTKIRKDKALKVITLLLMLLYAYLVIDITLISRQGTVVEDVSLVPFESYWTAMTTGWGGSGQFACMAIIGNAFMFIPLGMMVAIVVKEHPFVVSAVTGFVFSIIIEVAQFMTKLGTFEFDDLINNTWGAIIGCSIAIVFLKRRKIRSILKTLIPLEIFVSVIVIMWFSAYIIDTVR